MHGDLYGFVEMYLELCFNHVRMAKLLAKQSAALKSLAGRVDALENDPVGSLSATQPMPPADTVSGVYSMTFPDPPATGRRVIGAHGYTYQRVIPDGTFNPILMPWGAWMRLDDEDGLPLPGVYTWPEILAAGPLALLPLTEKEMRDAELYGPPGARWGNPDERCPFWGFICTLGVGHTGPHIGPDGAPLGETEPDGKPPVNAGITPAQASETPCTCGRPAQHRPGCPRHKRWTGAVPMAGLPVQFEVPTT